jgi:GntR family transcriptional regulator
MKNQTPTSKRLHDTLSSMIDHMPAGQKLPSEPELARQLKVSRATLREVMRTFETQGRIHRRQGAGTFVARPSQVIESGLEVLDSIETIANRIGLPVALGERDLEVRPASEKEQSILGLPPGTQVLQAARVILAEGQPAAYLIDILSADLLPPAEVEKSSSGSVLDLLLKRSDLNPDISRCDVNAVTASPEIARAMGIQRGDVLLRFESMLYDRSGKVIVYSFSYFLPGHFRFHIVRRVGGLH